MGILKRKNTLTVLVLLAVIAIVFFIINRPESAASEQTTDDAYVQADITYVSPQISGAVSSILVKDNQQVSKGTLLATIDERDFTIAVEGEKARVDIAKAAIAETESKVQLQDSLIGQALAVLQSDEAQRVLAEADHKRYQNLAADGSGTRQAAQQAAAQLKVRNAAVEKSNASLQAENRQKVILYDRLKQEQAQLQEALAALANAELKLSWTQIYAPVNGTIGLKSIRLGAYVNTGETLLALVPGDQLYITANYRETQLKNIRVGQPVDISIDAFPGVIVKGTVESMGPASGVSYSVIPPHNATGNFTKIVQRLPLKITINPGQDILSLIKVGMSVQPKIHTE